jgi:hypothetical protein
MTRLPTPGSDQGQWGDILNDYLSVSHTSDGSLKGGTVGTTQLQDNSITGTKLANDTIPAGKLSTPTQTSLTKADTSVQSVNTVFPTSGNVTLTPSDIGAASQSALTALDTAVEKTSQLDTTGHAASKASLDALSGLVGSGAQLTATTQAANYTLALADDGTAVEATAAVTFTVPLSASVAFPVGAVIELVRAAAGAVTITPASGVLIRNRIDPAGTASRTIANQWSSASLRKRATNEWVLVGDIA